MLVLDKGINKLISTKNYFNQFRGKYFQDSPCFLVHLKKDLEHFGARFPVCYSL